MSASLLSDHGHDTTPSERIEVRYNADTQTTTIEISDLRLYLNTPRELYWTLGFVGVALTFVVYACQSAEPLDTTSISIMVILSVCGIASLANLLSLWLYYCVVLDAATKRSVITVSKQNNNVSLSGYGFWNKFVCGCLFGRSIYLKNVGLKNALIQYRLTHRKYQTCPSICGDKLFFYIRGYDEMLNVNDSNNQLDVESEEQTLCHQQWNQATVNVLKNVLTYEERRWLLLYLIKNSYCAVLKSVDNASAEYGLILPSEHERVIDL